jgi:MFS family permease
MMRDKGMSDPQVFIMLLLLLAGGAGGKFIVGWLDDHYGSLPLIWGTKGLTAALLLAALATPPVAMAPLMLVLGIGLNGTSSVLYSKVSTFVPRSRRSRAYGYYYTVTEAAGSVAPILYGRLADLLSLRAAVGVMSLITWAILPASLALRKPIAEAERPVVRAHTRAD